MPRSCAIRTQEICSYVPQGSCARKMDLAYHYNANPRSRIPASERGNRSPTTDFNRYKPRSISGKSTLLQVQTRPRTKKNPEKEISERCPVHAMPKGPAIDKPTLMPTEASNVSPSDPGLSRGNLFSSRFEHGPDLRRTWERKITGAMPCPGEACCELATPVDLSAQVIPRVRGRNREIRGKLVGKSHPGLGRDTCLQVPVKRTSGSDPCIDPCL
ncbi:hypothetical protein DY000_02030972 [Brassica cretica]|uniref:MBD domain-containing protein n=1 Tax=Brassica cretica TaxID=69181 RepID=A0ABQ7DPT5_BRACR|nr:hypothetical protein DY000_02030972 [Brassica cretica]